MKLLQNKIYLDYTTTDYSKNVIEKLQESYSQFILTVIDYYIQNNLPFTKFDEDIYPLDIQFKSRILKFLTLSIEYYFHCLQLGITVEKVKKLVSSDIALAFRRKDCVLSSDRATGVILIPDVNIIVSVDYNFINESIKEIYICKNKVILGE